MTQRQLSSANSLPNRKGDFATAARRGERLAVRKSEPKAEKTSCPALTAARLQRLAEDWLLDSECRFHSPKTIALRRLLCKNLLWWLTQKECPDDEPKEIRVTPARMREFLVYVGKADPYGRWGNPRLRSASTARTVKTYDEHLRTFFGWCVAQGEIASHPMQAISPTVYRKSQIGVFSDAQVVALVEASKRTPTARRDIAIVLFLFDTGVRASELCAIRIREIDLENRRVSVLGKGNKSRTVVFGRKCSRALWNYLQDGRRRGDGQHPHPDEPLFRGIKGNTPGSALTPRGLHGIIERIGVLAGVSGIRCSPHTLRHTFATNMIRSGVPAFTLQQMLGHTSLNQTQIYVSLAQGDIENQHRLHSMVDKMLG